MKKKLAAIVSTLALASCNAGNGKNDILGFAPGLYRENAHKLAASNNWNCKPGGMWGSPEHEETCSSANGVLTLFFSKNIEGEPIYRVGLDFNAARNNATSPIEIQAKEVSAQYGKSPDGTGESGELIWKLDNGNVLILEGHNYISLLNEGIYEQTAINNAPKTPKF